MSDMRKDHHPTQPLLVKHTCEPNRKEIREQILESAGFAIRIGERLRDELTDPQAGLIAYYIRRKDEAELGRYVREILAPHVQSVLDDMVEEYIDREFVTVEG